MIISNPINLAPLLTQLSAVNQAVIAARDDVASVQNAVGEIQSTVDNITTVNGEISTEVQAINQHTSDALLENNSVITNALSSTQTVVTNAIAAKSAIKAKHVLTASASGNFAIPAVNVNKTVLNIVSNINNSGESYYRAFLTNSTTVTLQTYGPVFYNGNQRVQIEVIEYA